MKANAILIAAALAVSQPAYADDARPAPVLLDATTADAAPPIAVPPGPVIVDTEAGTVTPAPGTPAADATERPLDVAQAVVTNVRAGQWRLALAGLLGLLMVLGVKYAPALFGRTDRGKALAVMVLALLGTLSAALAASSVVTIGLVLGAVGVAWTAVGARQWLSRFLWPQDGGKQWATWLQPLLGVKPKSNAPAGLTSSPPSE